MTGKSSFNLALNTHMIMGSIAAAVGLTMIGGLMNKMFGENMPKGVVREIMQGVMDGLVTHFEIRIDDLKRDKENLEKKVAELEPWKERFEELLESQQKTKESKNGKTRRKR